MSNVTIFFFFCFFFNDTSTTEIYTLSLHDALPISTMTAAHAWSRSPADRDGGARDRKSTRLNSSHTVSSYAVFCLKKKKTHIKNLQPQTITLKLETYTRNMSE